MFDIFFSFIVSGAVKPFVLFVVTDANENLDIANRGFSLDYSQNQCPVA